MTKLLVGTTRDGKPFTLPETIVTSTMAILAKKGAGKTYTAGVIEEEFAKNHLPFVVLDPVGVHYGLRSSADGKKPGYPVVVFGGQHADVPLYQKMGSDLARTIATENISVIIDLSELSKTAWREFVRDFCRTLFTVNKTPRHVFIEEATEFVPQRQMTPGMQETYEAVERMIRLGRNRGIGVTMIAQRSAQVAKDVLSQIDILIAMRHTGLHDRNAITDAVKDDLDEEQLRIQMPEFRAGVTRLDDGEAWVWWPKNGIFQQIKVRRRETYHGGATPTFGKQAAPVMAVPDLDKLRVKFKEVIEQRESDDPKKLHARIKELEREHKTLERHYEVAMSAAVHPKPCGHEPVIDKLMASAAAASDAADRLMDSNIKLFTIAKEAHAALEKALGPGIVVREEMPDFKNLLVDSPKKLAQVATRIIAGTEPPPCPDCGRKLKPGELHTHGTGFAPSLVMARAPIEGISSSQQKILNAIAAFEALGMADVPRPVVAAHAGVRHTTGTFRNNISKLFTSGLIAKSNANTLALTDEGRAAAQAPETPLTLAEFHQAWRDLLTSSQAAMLDAVIRAHPDMISREQVAVHLQVQAETGTFRNNVSKLSVLGLVAKPASGMLRATEFLFPAGLR